jgi:hypothetical protein
MIEDKYTRRDCLDISFFWKMTQKNYLDLGE